MSSEHALTVLLGSIFDWVEHNHSDWLNFENVNLRRAMERYFYFEAISQPEKLNPLLNIAKGWRLGMKDSTELSQTYDLYLAAAKRRGAAKKLQDCITPWFRILGDFFLHVKSIIRPIKRYKAINENQKKVGFFAINSRFLHVFQELGQHFDQEEKMFFSSNANMMRSHCGGQNTFAVDVAFNIPFASLSLSFKDSLFPVYFRLCFFYRRIYATLHRFQPNVLLFAEGTSHYDELAAQAARTLNIPTVRLQSGRAGILHSGYQDMSFDLMVCWGEGFIERYKEASQKPKYVACGSPLVDAMQSYHLPENRRGRTVVIFTQPVSRHISKMDYMSLVQLTEKIASQTNDYKVVVRMHPVDKSKEFYKLASHYESRVKIMNPPDFSLANVMAVSQCAVGFFSTALSEAAACNVIPIILKLSDSHSVFPFPEKHGAAIVVESTESAIKKVNEVMIHPENFSELRRNMRQFSSRYFGEYDGGSIPKLVNTVRTVVDRATHD